MILVTDEDRDDTIPLTFEETLALLQDNDWQLHGILNQNLIPFEAVGTKVSDASTEDDPQWTYYLPNPFPNGTAYYNETETTVNTIGAGAGTTSTDYVPLAFATSGAVWNLNRLRTGGFIAEVFAVTFTEVTSMAIDAADPPAQADSDCSKKRSLFGSLSCK